MVGGMKLPLPLFCLVLMLGPAIAADSNPPIQHIVFCWLKEPGNEQHRQQVIEATYSFLEIPGVLAVSAGPPLPSDRDVVDATYDVGLIITLENAAALEAYLPHPIHVRQVEEVIRPLVERILVYDFAVQPAP